MTGWKSLFAVGNFPKYINELDPEESEDLLKKFYSVILENHELQCRFKWRNVGDIGKSFLLFIQASFLSVLVFFIWMRRRTRFLYQTAMIRRDCEIRKLT